MKYVITESQHIKLTENLNTETINKVSTNWFKKQIKQGEDPHIDGSLLMFLNVKMYEHEYLRLLDVLRSFLGDAAAQVLESKSEKTYDTNDYPNISGGYDFKFIISGKQIEGTQVLFDIDILPGGEVTLITDGETLNLDDALNDEDMGFEIQSEVDDVIYSILNKEISHYTGYAFAVNHIEY